MQNTVLVTGSSAGIGEEFAWQLARLGYNLLLVARRTDKLSALQKAITLKFPRQKCLTLALDLNEESATQSINNFVDLQQIELVGLINNAGFGARGAFAELSEDRQRDMVQVNILCLTRLTHAFIPYLKKQKNTFIINVASTAAFQAGPNLAIYYASKAFVLSFSEALHEELKGQIQVSALCPGATKTEFAQIAGMSDSLVFKMRVMEKQAVVSFALKNRHKAIAIPGLINKIGVIIVKLLPRSITRKLAFQIQK
ncbi:short-chain dehydrogenase [Psychromonas sp. psych-6C06]|uniref:SDR family NAD(P)-dependent oxidoreductase n=1 Tax=Psychromonas sp. psych-6C06 TaxID=2058089 RepID=UPI000C341F14|nr:SDR family oxidoreductase [Psychromonas sp. psych-6C06]PKF63681.1 short-chain dehydrogenase [Psychromonas sp. psych-6C06]